MVADINGTTTADVTNLTNVNGTLYFAAYTSENGFQVWQSNGTAAGTVMDTSLAKGATAPSDLTAVGNDLYFMAPGATLWEWAPSACAVDADDQLVEPRGDHVRHGAVVVAARRDGERGGELRLLAGVGHGAEGGERHAVGHLHTHRHHRLHDRDQDGDAGGGAGDADDHLGDPCEHRLRHGADGVRSSTRRRAWRGPSSTRRRRARCWPRGRDTLSVTFTPTDTTDY